MKKILIAICLALLCGCVDFGEQTILFYYLKDRDELRMLIVYRGIHYSNEPEKSQEQLKSFVTTNWEMALGDNWIGHITKKKLEDALTQENIPDSMKKLIRALMENITVTHGSFYLDEDKKLCGTQTVTLKNVSRLVRQLNTAISDSLIADKNASTPWGLSRDSHDLILAAARKDHPWVELAPQAIHGSFPMTDADFSQSKKKLLTEAVDVVKKYEANKQSIEDAIRAISENEISFAREGTFLRLTLGNPGARWPITVKTRLAGKKYENNLTEHVEKVYGIKKDVTEEQLTDQFVSALAGDDLVRTIQEHIGNLGNSQVRVRDQAVQALVDVGGLAVPWVRQAAKSDDPEIRHRARRILEVLTGKAQKEDPRR